MKIKRILIVDDEYMNESEELLAQEVFEVIKNNKTGIVNRGNKNNWRKLNYVFRFFEFTILRWRSIIFNVL
jgi:hypothetical protein